MKFLAPDDGYQTSGNFTRNNGIGLVNKAFFVKSRNGRVYSKLGLLIRINETPGGIVDITVGGVANTNASRNWEATAPQAQ